MKNKNKVTLLRTQYSYKEFQERNQLWLLHDNYKVNIFLLKRSELNPFL